MPFVSIRNQPEKIRVNTIYCIGRNYAEHAKELNNPIPSQPIVFLKPNACIELPEGNVILPNSSNDVHHEVELVLLIGKKGKNVAVSEAWDLVKGVGIGIDFTARDLQQKAKDKGHPWTLAKGFDTFGPVSEFVSMSEVDTINPFSLSLIVNDSVRQKGTTADMLFSIPELIAYVSSFSTLQEGDLIFTGTPQGVAKVEIGDTLKAVLNNGLVSFEVSVA